MSTLAEGEQPRPELPVYTCSREVFQALLSAMDSTKAFACALVTAPNMTVARKLATVALKGRLVACANLVPKIESHYWWQGAIETSAEVLIFFKTETTKLEALEKEIIKNHPYDTPEFIVLKLDGGNKKYLEWIAASVK